jgi:serine/threonine protein kinase
MMAAEFAAGSRFGRYILEERRGEGSFGQVWRARDAVTDETVADKLLTGTFAGTDSAKLRAEVELLAAEAARRSPHVVHVIGGDVDPIPYIVMEFIEGQNLAEILKHRGVLPADETVRIGLGVARALSALSNADIIHRDVKRANVMLDNDGTVNGIGVSWRSS